MKTTFKILFLSFFSIAALTTSCSKDGDTGPIGPQGEQGPAGEQGVQGPEGPAGEDGNANVIASEWFPLTFEKTMVNELPHFNGNKAVPEITSEIVEEGTVIVYGKLNGYTENVWPTDKVAQFPITLMYNALGNTQIDIYKAFISEGNIQFNVTENYDIHGGVSPYHMYRYIIIPTNSVTEKSQNPNFSKMTYREVMDHFGLDY
ncbi:MULTISPECIES: collagen-like protein [Zobellia]|uniref:Collagen-like protein n=1 Tax=Zobellia galactanivorans (strain DSM 12802 / CCUG 47099 / CIP 106680 / NCIMB 13871 / Dsij) TaxID=63186 RepID=G0L2I3_ZOBGA|nr:MULTISPECIES: collagen-like protein [Zobellia]MBU3024554.1 collagen-like protein [Zobellia galactanivorans]OWW26115.1 collagen-like protein [Zobellia sp. OII3]CAZ95004.1 Conserved hypothetical protein [Zobellia galactanivorans]